MKKSDFFEQLDQELDTLVPELSEPLKTAPIRTRAPAEDGERSEALSAGTSFGARLKGFLRRNAVRLAGVTASVLVLCLIALPIAFGVMSGSPAYIVMQTDINPSLSVLLDDSYTVCGVRSNNRDGDTLLEDGEFSASLIGLSAEQAAIRISEQAALTGFLDVEELGSAAQYNAVTVTLTADGRVSDTLAEEIVTGLEEYFCEKGVYVYAACEIARGETDGLVASFEESALVYERLSAAELEAYAEYAAYAYAEELLADALLRYDLYETVYTQNRELMALTDGRSYWELDEANEETAALFAEIERALSKLNVLYSASFASYGEFWLSYTTYRAGILLADVEALRALAKSGLNADTFGGVGNLGVRLNYYEFVGSDLFRTVLEELLDGKTDTLEALVSDVASLAELRISARLARYAALFRLPRAAIGEREYAQFLERIGKA